MGGEYVAKKPKCERVSVRLKRLWKKAGKPGSLRTFVFSLTLHRYCYGFLDDYYFDLYRKWLMNKGVQVDVMRYAGYLTDKEFRSLSWRLTWGE